MDEREERRSERTEVAYIYFAAAVTRARTRTQRETGSSGVTEEKAPG
jgi:hypothetical protein